MFFLILSVCIILPIYTLGADETPSLTITKDNLLTSTFNYGDIFLFTCLNTRGRKTDIEILCSGCGSDGLYKIPTKPSYFEDLGPFWIGSYTMNFNTSSVSVSCTSHFNSLLVGYDSLILRRESENGEYDFIGIIAGGILLLVFLILCVIIYFRKRKSNEAKVRNAAKQEIKVNQDIGLPTFSNSDQNGNSGASQHASFNASAYNTYDIPNSQDEDNTKSTTISRLGALYTHVKPINFMKNQEISKYINFGNQRYENEGNHVEIDGENNDESRARYANVMIKMKEGNRNSKAFYRSRAYANFN